MDSQSRTEVFKSGVIMKICSKCGVEKDKNNFSKNIGRKDDLQSWCKECMKIRRLETKEHEQERKKEYYRANKKGINLNNKKYYEANKEVLLEKQKNYRKNNKESISLTRKRHYNKNKDKVLNQNTIYRAMNREVIIKQKRSYYLDNKKHIIKYRKSNAKYSNYSDKLTKEESPKVAQDGVSLMIKCRYCGKYFIPTITQANNRVKSLEKLIGGDRYFYCAVNCKKACPIYRQVKYPKTYKKATSREVDPLVRQLCFERDKWKCKTCGKNVEETSLHCHHIEGYTQNPLLGNDVENTITLCKDCHKQVHKLPGCKYYELKCN